MMEQEKEKSNAVEIISDMMREIMCKIKEVDGIDKQQALALQFFKYLGSVKSLEEAAQKMLSIAMTQDKQEVADENSDTKDSGSKMMDSMYIED